MNNQAQESFHPSLFPQLNLPAATNVSNYYTVEVLHYIQMIKQSNAIAKQLQSNFTCDPSMLHQVIDHLTSGSSFTDEQLTAYFQIQQSLEEFHRTLDHSLQETLEVHLPYGVDFQLLGLDAKRYALLDHNNKIDLHQQYEIRYFELFENYTTLAEFIASAQKLVKRIMECYMD